MLIRETTPGAVPAAAPVGEAAADLSGVETAEGSLGKPSPATD
jgi:hypothetical protein